MLIHQFRSHVLSHSSSADKLKNHGLADSIRSIKNDKNFNLIEKLSNDPYKNRLLIKKLREKINNRNNKSNNESLKFKTLSYIYKSITKEYESCVNRLNKEVD